MCPSPWSFSYRLYHECFALGSCWCHPIDAWRPPDIVLVLQASEIATLMQDYVAALATSKLLRAGASEESITSKLFTSRPASCERAGKTCKPHNTLAQVNNHWAIYWSLIVQYLWTASGDSSCERIYRWRESQASSQRSWTGIPDSWLSLNHAILVMSSERLTCLQ